LSEQVAGVTLLAFANGASDVAVVVAAAVGSSEGAAMAVGEVLGSAMVVSCLVLGLIAYNFPFSPTKDFSRDICFLLVANFWLAMTLLDSVISTLESLGFMVLYGIYLFVAITIKGGGGPSQAGDSGGQVRQQEGGGAGAASEDGGRIPGEGKDGKGKAWFPMLQMQQMRGWQPPVVESEGEGLGGGSAGDGKGLVGLLVYVNPINSEILRAGSMRDKLLLGLRAPAVVILRLTVPVVDETRERLAWNKDAFLCQLVLAPSVLLWGLLLHNLTSISPANAYLAYAVALVLGAMAAALVQVSTRSVGAPGYHRLTSVLGFLVAVAWIYILAVELVHVLQALGRVFGVSDSILGLTVLGSSQSLGDLVTNYSVARGGMPVMAAAACIAAPLLDTLFGVGLAGLLGNLLVRAPFPMQLSVQLYVTECFLIFALVSMLALIMMQGSKVTKMFGVVLLIIFVGYLVTIVILEFFFGGKPNLLSLPMID
jgi:sodium/potassium/calcium exchanger 6